MIKYKKPDIIKNKAFDAAVLFCSNSNDQSYRYSSSDVLTVATKFEAYLRKNNVVKNN